MSKLVLLMSYILLISFSVQGNDDFVTGVCTHFAQGKNGGGQKVFKLLKTLRIDSIRDEAYWASVEKQKGKYTPKIYKWYVDSAIKFNLKPLTVLSFSNKLYDDGDLPHTPEGFNAYTAYCEAIAEEFKNKSGWFEIWNEWDAAFGGKKTACAGLKSPESYLELIKHVYPRLKKIAPESTILAGAVTSSSFKKGWMEKLVAVGGLKYCDAVSVHAYADNPEQWYEQMSGFEQRLKDLNGGKEVPVYITEMGWSNYISGSKRAFANRSTAAEYTAQTLLLAKTLNSLKGIWWYDYQDDGWDGKSKEDNYGIQRPDQTPKAAWFAMRDFNQLVKNAEFQHRINVEDPKIWILEFKSKNKDTEGELFWAIWSSHEDNDWQIILEKEAKASDGLTVQKLGTPAYKTDWYYRNWGEGLRNAVTHNEQFSLTVRGMPWIISGDLTGARVKSVTCRSFPEKAYSNLQPMLPEKILSVAKFVDKESNEENNFQEKKLPDNIEIQTMQWQSFGKKAPAPEDISGKFAVFYSTKNLYLLVDVTDNVHFQTHTDNGIWKEDSLQIAAKNISDPSSFKEPDRISELGIASVNDSPVVFRYNTQEKAHNGKMKTVESLIMRSNNRTIYWLKIPHYILDLPELKSGTMFALSLLVNECDGKGREGYLHWGEGIARGKNALQFNWIILR